MIIDCISDLHGFYPELPGGDLLIVCGDLTARDTYEEFLEFHDWFGEQKYTKRIVISGNHDNSIQRRLNPGFWNYGDYLEDSGTEFEGLRIWGTPWTKTFSGMNPKCKAFTCDIEEELAEKFALIPDDIDILITHSPPYGVLDCCLDHETGKYKYVGSTALLAEICDNPKRNRPALHVFGHIHENGGKQVLLKHLGPNTICVNCSYVNEKYQPVNNPVRIIL